MRVSTLIYFALAITAYGECIDLNPKPRRTEFVTDEYAKFRLNWLDFSRHAMVKFQHSKSGDSFLVVVEDGGSKSLTLDCATGKVSTTGNWKTSEAANEFWRCVKGSIEQDRKREVNEAVTKTIAEMLKPK